MAENRIEPLNDSSIISAIVCQACDWRGSSVNQAIGHELNRHGGAQTCWWNRESASVTVGWSSDAE